jgi:hypothetical protein
MNQNISWYDMAVEEEQNIFINKYNEILAKVSEAPGLNNEVSDYIIRNKEELLNLFKLTKILNVFGDLLITLLSLIKINKYKYITQNKECRYSIIDLNIDWIEKELVQFLHKMSKDLKTAIFIENKLNKMKSVIIIKSSFYKLKQLRLEYKKSRTLSLN